MPDAALTAVLACLAAAAGGAVGVGVNRAAARFPWKSAPLRGIVAPGAAAVRRPGVELGTALLFALVALRFGPAGELPAFLWFAGVAVLLTVIDVQHHLLPNRVVLPALAVGAVLLLGAVAAGREWTGLLGALLGAVVLFAVYLVLALLSPRSLGMGDVKLAALLGLYLGWLGWGAVLAGGIAGFVVQGVLALGLLATRRIGLRGDLPFGPAMLLGAAIAIGWSDALPR
ncbi:MAG: peptidase prepilin type [Blastococcus sp.]|nr:peptidase prepilin type [Blastococcus sp.]